MPESRSNVFGISPYVMVSAVTRTASSQAYIVLPDGTDHDVDAVAADVGLDTVPDASHGCSVEDGPQAAPDAEGGPADDGVADVVDGADATCQDDEDAGNEVADPDAEPCLPPVETSNDHGRTWVRLDKGSLVKEAHSRLLTNHPRVDV